MTVWVVSAKSTERVLIVAELTEEGFDARGFESVANLMASLEGRETPNVLILDAGETELARDKWDTIKALAPTVHTILIAGLVSSPLPADQILRRPFSIAELACKIKEISGGTQ